MKIAWYFLRQPSFNFEQKAFYSFWFVQCFSVQKTDKICTRNEKNAENNEAEIKNKVSMARTVLSPLIDTFIVENSLFKTKKPLHFLIATTTNSDVSFKFKQNG